MTEEVPRLSMERWTTQYLVVKLDLYLIQNTGSNSKAHMKRVQLDITRCQEDIFMVLGQRKSNKKTFKYDYIKLIITMYQEASKKLKCKSHTGRRLFAIHVTDI